MNLVWLKLIKRILTHKYYVAKYCFQIGLYWQGITHDLSKFSFIEFSRAIKYWDNKMRRMSVEYQDIVKHFFIIEKGILTIMNIGYIPQIMEEFLLKCLKNMFQNLYVIIQQQLKHMKLTLEENIHGGLNNSLI